MSATATHAARCAAPRTDAPDWRTALLTLQSDNARTHAALIRSDAALARRTQERDLLARVLGALLADEGHTHEGIAAEAQRWFMRAEMLHEELCDIMHAREHGLT